MIELKHSSKALALLTDLVNTTQLLNDIRKAIQAAGGTESELPGKTISQVNIILSGGFAIELNHITPEYQQQLFSLVQSYLESRIKKFETEYKKLVSSTL